MSTPGTQPQRVQRSDGVMTTVHKKPEKDASERSRSVATVPPKSSEASPSIYTPEQEEFAAQRVDSALRYVANNKKKLQEIIDGINTSVANNYSLQDSQMESLIYASAKSDSSHRLEHKITYHREQGASNAEIVDKIIESLSDNFANYSIRQSTSAVVNIKDAALHEMDANMFAFFTGRGYSAGF